MAAALNRQRKVHPHSLISAWPSILGALAGVLLVSGLDDLIPTLICAFHALKGERSDADSNTAIEERPVAIFVPCWKEAAVIGNMIRHNVASIAYGNYDFFIGVYPNDAATLEAAQQLAATFRRVHVACAPHPGPTSKADCLNAIYRRMLAHERERGIKFDTIVLHDAEDLICSEALSLINRERTRHAMVQVPVLPLPTPIHEFTHAVYCDDFAEFQIIDMRARQFSGAFIPSNGVGTGFAREVLERLAAERNGLVFHPVSLTEDYEAGVYIHKAGYSQRFVPLSRSDSGFCATREYFPRRVRSAIRQRTRWITGIALQSWARDGWRGSWITKYWFWRDRKGLLANPLSLLTNLLFVAGAADWLQAAVEHRPWAFAVSSPAVLKLCIANSGIQVLRLSLRVLYTSRIYNFAFAAAVPLRTLHGNFINCCASLNALWQFAVSQWKREPLVWSKTEHAYPGRDAVVPIGRRLEEVLAGSGYLNAQELAEVRATLNSDQHLADYLLQNGLISDHDLCSAVSLQSGVPFARVDARRTNRWVARTLPAWAEGRFGIVPFGLDSGRLFVAGCRVPSSAVYEELKRISDLPIEFHLVTRSNYDELRRLLA